MGAKCLEPEGKSWYNKDVHESLKQISQYFYDGKIEKRSKEGANARRDLGRMMTYYINDQRCGNKRSYGETVKRALFIILRVAIIVSIILRIIFSNIQSSESPTSTAFLQITNALQIVLTVAIGLYLLIVFDPFTRPLPIINPTEVLFIFVAGAFLVVTALQDSWEWFQK